MSGEIRKLRDLGNGSGGMVIPKETLRSWGLIDDDDGVVDAHLMVSQSDEAITVRPIGMSAGGVDEEPSKPKRAGGRSIPGSKADL
ncbi:hypothetical protein EKH57_00840 [Halorubrum sp. BOL3-1]|uniref:hypothetical protein n=1 Tax=Halorubrum sp. BOL3-1 TaxID=2497325 RepID=UPI0010050BF1|nr:hypothetical protein [Halorubrum sp. BOL3-1]QAU11451.1 hypothetical protein EKH57_00840 [Halorubrum sp. BOL3-1]